ncbi:PAS domain-containing protein [Algoriphagus boritolerans]|uniref:PAS domain-containing protein n=1 Tax=Algoriphagus boritolerans TaxID=308111 RepID=UPI002FCE4207
MGFQVEGRPTSFFTSKLDLIAIGKYDHLTYLNSTVLSVLGYEVEELLNTNLCPFIHEDDLERVQKNLESNSEKPRGNFSRISIFGKRRELQALGVLYSV